MVPPRSGMADVAVLGGSALGVAVDAEAHVDLVHRLHSIHRLHQAVTGLAGQPGVDMRAMGETHEIGQGIDPVPANLKRRLGIVGPRPSYRQQAASLLAAVASHAALDGRRARGLRAPRVLMAVLAGDLVDAGVDAVAERDRLVDVVARRPRPLGKSDHAEPADEHQQRQREQGAVEIEVHFKSGSAFSEALTQPSAAAAAYVPARRVPTKQPSHAKSTGSRALRSSPRRRQTNRGFQTTNAKRTNIALGVHQEKVMAAEEFSFSLKAGAFGSFASLWVGKLRPCRAARRAALRRAPRFPTARARRLWAGAEDDI